LREAKSSGRRSPERSINTWGIINDKVNSAEKDGLISYVLTSEEINGHQKKI
jgi:hypothetical protein